jgi:hypothetical protein
MGAMYLRRVMTRLPFDLQGGLSHFQTRCLKNQHVLIKVP